jgi:hypothetical protein
MLLLVLCEGMRVSSTNKRAFVGVAGKNVWQIHQQTTALWHLLLFLLLTSKILLSTWI